jgi:hypothetical protein
MALTAEQIKTLQERSDRLAAIEAREEKGIKFSESKNGALSVTVNGSYPITHTEKVWMRLSEIMPDIMAELAKFPGKYVGSKDTVKA